MMAKILNQKTKQPFWLLPQQHIGRQVNYPHLQIQGQYSSRLHGLVDYNGEYWFMKDTSRNGIFINGQRITTQRLKQGDNIHFGHRLSDQWQIVDTSPPTNMLLPENSQEAPCFLQGTLALPDEKKPTLFIYQTNNRWLCESDAGVHPLQPFDLIRCASKAWYFIETQASNKTQQQLKPAATALGIHFHFSVSQNEEHVFLNVDIQGQQHVLGERSHHYLLLQLARKREADKRKGIAESEQGWLDKDSLSQSLGLSESHLNIQIYRLRKQLETLPEQATMYPAIERRYGQLRFGSGATTILGGLGKHLYETKVVRA